MSITDELRKWAEGSTLSSWTAERLTAIADRIDAEHEAMLVDARKTVYQGYIELPKDADNVPWHVGDRDEDGNVVTELRIAAYGWWVIAGGICRRSYRCRHYHHAPTVEDVLHDLICDVEEDVRDEREIIAEYAAKLRLAGSDAE